MEGCEQQHLANDATTATELNQAIAILEGMSGVEHEVFQIASGRKQQNPASVVFQTGVFMEVMATQKATGPELEKLTCADLQLQFSTERAILVAILKDPEVRLAGDEQAQFEARVQAIDQALLPLEEEGPIGPRVLDNMTVAEASAAVAFVAAVSVEVELGAFLSEASLTALLESRVALTLVELAPIAATTLLQGDSSPPVSEPGPTDAQIAAASTVLTAAAMNRMQALFLEAQSFEKLGELIRFVETPSGPTGPSPSEPEPTGPRFPMGLLIPGAAVTAAALLAQWIPPSPQKKSGDEPSERLDGKETGKREADGEAQMGFARTTEEIEKDGYLTKPPGPDERRLIPIENDMDLPTNALSAEASGKGEKGEDTSERLRELRDTLSTEEGRKAFDDFVAARKQVGQAVRALDGMANSTAGLEGNHLKKGKKPQPSGVVAAPHGDGAGDLPTVRQRVDELALQIESVVIPGVDRLRNKLNNEINAQLIPMENGTLPADLNRVQGLKNNVQGIERELSDAVARKADEVEVRVKYGDGKELEVDNISNGGKTWTEVKATKPFSTASTSWTREVQRQAERFSKAAEEHGVKDRRYSFPLGVDPSVKEALEHMGFTVEGEVVSASIMKQGD